MSAMIPDSAKRAARLTANVRTVSHMTKILRVMAATTQFLIQLHLLLHALHLVHDDVQQWANTFGKLV